MLTQAQADVIISQAQYPHHWCNARVCGRLGCVNKHGGVEHKGVTFSQWMDWKRRNPEKESSTAFYSSERQKELNDVLKTVFSFPECDSSTCDSDAGSSCSGGE